jgi:hypothetical protein
VFPVYPFSFAHAPRYVYSAVSPLPLLRLVQRHWGLSSFAPFWYLGAPFPMGLRVRVVPGVARNDGNWRLIDLSPAPLHCIVRGGRSLDVCVRLLDVALVLGIIVLVTARVCCLCRRLFP